MRFKLDHIAILVDSLRAASAALPGNFRPGEIEYQPTEGTLEQYVDAVGGNYPSLLLIEAQDEGPYTRAMKKRGPGLHHFGRLTDDIMAALDRLGGQGMLLHPISAKTLARKTVWMCRPGVPFLIELIERTLDGTDDGPTGTLRIETPGAARECACGRVIPGVSVVIRNEQKLRICDPDGTLDISFPPR